MPGPHAQANATQPRTLYERIGGRHAVESAVEVFYKKVVADKHLAPFFKGIDMHKLRGKQAMLLTHVLGGPAKFDVDNVFRVHLPLIRDKGLTLIHFNRVSTYLLDSLLELKVPYKEVEEVGKLVLSLEHMFDPSKMDDNARRYGTKKSGPRPLYERIGGEPAVEATVERFYKKVLADPELLPFFEGVDMKRQKAKQAAFVTYAFGGASSYDGKDLGAAHAHLIREKGLNLHHFDKVAGHLVKTMQELGVPQDLIDEAAAIVMTTRPIFDPKRYKAGITPASEGSLFDRIGGEAAVEATVNRFYKKVLADPLLAPFFEGIDMKQQKAKQTAFITYAFGGSGTYAGRDLAAAHEHLIREHGLGLKHFDAVAGRLEATMRELGVPGELMSEAGEIVMATRPIFDPARYNVKRNSKEQTRSSKEHSRGSKEHHRSSKEHSRN